MTPSTYKTPQWRQYESDATMTPNFKDETKLKRTTIRLPDFIYDQVAEIAAEHGQSLNQFTRDALIDKAFSPDITDARPNELKGMIVGALLSIDLDQIIAPGLNNEQKQAVIDGINLYLLKKPAYMAPD